MQTRGRISDGLLENLLFRELFILWMSGDKIFWIFVAIRANVFFLEAAASSSLLSSHHRGHISQNYCSVIHLRRHPGVSVKGSFWKWQDQVEDG